VTRPIAVVDCGTNTTRLLITDGESIEIRDQHITGLGRGLGQSGQLKPLAIERTVTALEHFGELLRANDVSTVRAIATSAARDARNRDAFFGPGAAALGHDIGLLSGDDEARYGFAGATSGFDPAGGPVLVVDIGGGSTEFALGRPGETPEVHSSLQMGSVRFTEEYLHHDPPWASELSAAISVARLHLDDLLRDHPSVADAPSLVAVAGTATTVAAVELGMADYDRAVIDEFTLSKAAAEDVFRTLATESLEDRVFNPGLLEARADVIVGGCCILVAVMRHLEFDECRIRDHDLLDGLAAELLK
jgi:exopolyphosphatase/guanosine-5'-triphosphate,3'-diphosphate pyrophosphatase